MEIMSGGHSTNLQGTLRLRLRLPSMFAACRTPNPCTTAALAQDGTNQPHLAQVCPLAMPGVVPPQQIHAVCTSSPSSCLRGANLVALPPPSSAARTVDQYPNFARQAIRKSFPHCVVYAFLHPPSTGDPPVWSNSIRSAANSIMSTSLTCPENHMLPTPAAAGSPYPHGVLCHAIMAVVNPTEPDGPLGLTLSGTACWWANLLMPVLPQCLDYGSHAFLHDHPQPSAAPFHLWI